MQKLASFLFILSIIKIVKGESNGSIRNSMGNDYVNVIAPFLNYEVFIILVILTFIFGLISAYLGKIVLKKHFERAGIA